MRSLILAVATIALLGTAETAAAKPLSTPPVYFDKGAGGFVGCLVTNTTAKPIGPVTVDVLDDTGAKLSGGTFGSIAPEATVSLLPNNSALGTLGLVRCKVDGKGVAKNKTLITLCVFPPGSLTCEAAVTVP
jgi:hypothetical protein